MNDNIGITVYLGDSITAGYRVKNEDCWVSSMPESVNCGLDGDTTDSMLKRYKRFVLDYKPARIVIFGGVNDIANGRNWLSVTDNIKKMTELAKENNIEPVLVTYFTPDYDRLLGENRENKYLGINRLPDELWHYNRWIREYAASEHILCMDLEHEFPNNINMEYCRYFFEDGIHPNAFGHALIKKIALKILYNIDNT